MKISKNWLIKFRWIIELDELNYGDMINNKKINLMIYSNLS